MSRLSVDSRDLIDAARDGDEPTAEDRARVHAALARKIALGVAAGVVAATVSRAAAGATAATATGAAGAIAATATTTTTSVGVAGGALGGGTIAGGVVSTIAGSLGAKLLVSVAIVSAVGAGTVTYQRHEETKRAAAAKMAMTAPVDARAAKDRVRDDLALPNALPIPSATSDTAPTPIALPTAILVAPSSATAPEPANATAPSPTPLDAELALLQDVHSALRANDGARALRVLAEHARRFPGGQLREEAEAGRVFALCELGRVDEARDVAGRFLREHPRSPLAPRVSRACDDADGASTF